MMDLWIKGPSPARPVAFIYRCKSSRKRLGIVDESASNRIAELVAARAASNELLSELPLQHAIVSD